jgi:hypothetical protein
LTWLKSPVSCSNVIPIPAARSAIVLITNAPIRMTPAMETKALFSESFV